MYLSINLPWPCAGVLKVGGETKEGMPEPIPRQSDIPDLTMPHYFFGGVPPGFKTSFTLPQSFLGCMSDLQVLQEVYNPMKGAFWGIQKGCSDKVSALYKLYSSYHSHLLLEFNSTTEFNRAEY